MKKLLFLTAALCLVSSSLFAVIPIVTDPDKGDWPVTRVVSLAK